MASFHRILRAVAVLGLIGALAACGAADPGDPDDARGGEPGRTSIPGEDPDSPRTPPARGDESIWDLFGRDVDPGETVAVNRYLWHASLEVLDFLPVETVDPFSGVFVTGYGTPPGGGQAYRAAVLVKDPALDARSLNLALHTRGGPVGRETVRAVEDAILTRARELRIEDRGL